MNRSQHEHAPTALRSEIANRAARLLAEGHVHDFAQAKRKAARQMGISENSGLPSNQEISAALTQYRAVFQPEHAKLLDDYRQKAAYLMHFFASFRPYLTGSVLSGAAGPHSDINLLLYHDDPKSLEIFLIDRKIDYQHRETPGMPHIAGYPNLAFYYDDTPVLLHLRPLSAERITYNKEERASLIEVERMIDTP